MTKWGIEDEGARWLYFEPHYEKKLDVLDGGILGLEHLLRRHHQMVWQIYQQTVIDTHNAHAFAKLSVSNRNNVGS